MQKDFVRVMHTLYETPSDDLLLLINDESPLVQAVVQWRYDIGK